MEGAFNGVQSRIIFEIYLGKRRVTWGWNVLESSLSSELLLLLSFLFFNSLLNAVDKLFLIRKLKIITKCAEILVAVMITSEKEGMMK